ncbi:MAG: hypothetical protein QGG50_03190, partial [Methanopyri archaeon]|nr:hypothetical protein [Methanopyri archaeon]
AGTRVRRLADLGGVIEGRPENVEEILHLKKVTAWLEREHPYLDVDRLLEMVGWERAGTMRGPLVGRALRGDITREEDADCLKMCLFRSERGRLPNEVELFAVLRVPRDRLEGLLSGGFHAFVSPVELDTIALSKDEFKHLDVLSARLVAELDPEDDAGTVALALDITMEEARKLLGFDRDLLDRPTDAGRGTAPVDKAAGKLVTTIGGRIRGLPRRVMARRAGLGLGTLWRALSHLDSLKDVTVEPTALPKRRVNTIEQLLNDVAETRGGLKNVELEDVVAQTSERPSLVAEALGYLDALDRDTETVRPSDLSDKETIRLGEITEMALVVWDGTGPTPPFLEVAGKVDATLTELRSALNLLDALSDLSVLEEDGKRVPNVELEGLAMDLLEYLVDHPGSMPTVAVAAKALGSSPAQARSVLLYCRREAGVRALLDEAVRVDAQA